MIRNYFKIAWRSLVKNKGYSAINIGGLAIGMAVAMIIGFWIYDELSFNKGFKNHDHVAQVIQNVTNNGEVQTWWNVPGPLANELRENYGSNFKYVVMAVNPADHILTFNEKKLTTLGTFFEKDAPKMFSLEMAEGNWNSLNDPSSILLSSSTAKAYFGNEAPMGKTIKIDDMPPVKVTGIYKDFPQNSRFAGLNFMSTWDFLYNNSDWMKTANDPWRPNFTTLFVQLSDNVDFDAVSAKIKDAKLKKVNSQLAKKKPALFLHPMNKWHLYSEFKNGINIGGPIQYVWMFGIIGVFVLLLACINFMNLSTAHSEKRGKEVGIRKTVGSIRSQLVLQFFSESLLTVIFAFALSLIIAQLVLPFFNEVADKKMFLLWSSPIFWLVCLGFTLLTGLIAGSYPAFYLSSFKPLKVLKGTFKVGRYATIPRKILVVLQFTVSVSLIIGTIIVYQQIQFAKNRPVGYVREGLVSIPLITSAIHDHFNVIKDELLNTGTVSSIAESGSSTTGILSSTSGFSWEGKDPNLSIDFGYVNVSYDYGKTIGWQIRKGRNFSKEFATDSSAVILNDAAIEYMGLKKPIGQKVTLWDQAYTIIGIVNDMIMESPYDEPKPIIYNLSAYAGSIALVKISPTASARDALDNIGTIFKKFNPDQPFEYGFVDEEYARKFGNEERIGSLAGFFAILAIFISCLGLFGLASFAAEQRTKEIGIRKVLGASVVALWRLLSAEFFVLVLLSCIIAAPIAYYYLKNWLNNYDYRIEIKWQVFLVATLAALVITLLTVSYQAIKAALQNPVKSLRTE